MEQEKKKKTKKKKKKRKRKSKQMDLLTSCSAICIKIMADSKIYVCQTERIRVSSFQYVQHLKNKLLIIKSH